MLFLLNFIYISLQIKITISPNLIINLKTDKMGACVTPSNRTRQPLKSVQIKEGSIVQPAPTSALRYIPPGTPQRSSLVNRDIINSQIRSNSLERPISPGVPPANIPNTSYLVRQPSVSSDLRPAAQSILPNSGLYDSKMYGVQRPSIQSQPMTVNSNIISTEYNLGRPLSPRVDNIGAAQPFSIRPTSVPSTQQISTQFQEVQRTSVGIPYPIPQQQSQVYQPTQSNVPAPQQIISQTISRKDSKLITNAPFPIMPTNIQPQIMTSTVNRIVNTSSVPVNVPNQSYLPINNMSGNQSTIISPSINSQFPSGLNSSSVMRQTQSHEVRQVVPNAAYNTQVDKTILSPQVVAPVIPNLMSLPESRPMTPLNPNINFDKRLLNFDRAMFATDTKTPRVSTFTYDLDLPISGQNKIRIL